MEDEDWRGSMEWWNSVSSRAVSLLFVHLSSIRHPLALFFTVRLDAPVFFEEVVFIAPQPMPATIHVSIPGLETTEFPGYDASTSTIRVSISISPEKGQSATVKIESPRGERLVGRVGLFEVSTMQRAERELGEATMQWQQRYQTGQAALEDCPTMEETVALLLPIPEFRNLFPENFIGGMISTDTMANNRWRSIRHLTDNSTKFAPEWFEPGEDNMKCIENTKVLVVGAGGLGCELLKNLALSGFKKIHVIDMDTIDLSNLNRQFLFRESDIGKSKAEVAARKIEDRVKGVQVTSHNCRIEEKPPSFYRSFHMVICGLDSIDARRWLNELLCSIVRFAENGDPENVIPLIDGGTEGFKGNARVITPRFSACVECTLDLYPPQVNFPLCTIANTPRLPEHCVEYVKAIQWGKDKPFNGAVLDTDSPEHVDWCYSNAIARAEQFNIKGVDRRLTQGVLKRIIPAVASTNAVIAAACTTEAIKLASNISFAIKNYMVFTDIDGAFMNVVEMEKNERCNVCSSIKASISVKPSTRFSTLFDSLVSQYNLQDPTIRCAAKILYMKSTMVPEVQQDSEANLQRPIDELISDGEELLIKDSALPKDLNISIIFGIRESAA